MSTVVSQQPAPGGTLEKILEGLTDEQSEAVKHAAGPLMIVAGAGTGKTTVVTRRIAHLVAVGLAEPGEILALTFTDKAAQEMQERVDVLLPYGYAEVNISTFHSFGDRLLRRYALELGIDPEFKVLSSPEQILFLREHLFDLPLERYRPPGNPTGHLAALTSHFGKAKDENRSPEEYLAFAEKLFAEAHGDPVAHDRALAQLELARCYQAYQRLMKDHGYLDFGDQVYLVLRLLSQRPTLLSKLQQQFKYLLVDEFQDTNYAQFALVKMLAGERRNLTVVGDDDQSIYQFRGAALTNILEFTRVFPETRQVVLRHNFRSTQTILDAAYRSIVHNNPERLEVKNGINKQLISSFEGDEPQVLFNSYDRTTSEADAVASRIAEWVKSERYGYDDIAILVRVNREADPYLRALNMHGIPFRFTGNRGLYQRPEIRLIFSFMRSLADPHDSISHYHLASSELFELPLLALALLSSWSTRRNLPLRKAMERHADLLKEDEDLLDLDEDGKLAIGNFLEFLNHYLELVAEESPGRLLYRFITESGWLEKLSSGELGEGEIRIQNIARFFDIVKNFETLYPGAQLPQFVQHLDLLIDAGDSPAVVEADAATEAVEVLTVHKSKGLEFPAVFLVGLSEGSFPTRERTGVLEFPRELERDPNADSAERHVAEERRLFYVALTRAKESLLLSNALDGGGRRTQKVSRFVMEALDQPRVDRRVVKTSSLEALSQFAPKPVAEQKWSTLPADRVLTVSFRKIDDYLTCPLKYKYTQVLRVPIAPHHSVVYGNALHLAVSAYLEQKQEGQSLEFEVLKQHFDKAWTAQGFLTPDHEKQRYSAGLEALQRFHQEEENSPQIPTVVEDEFAFFIGRNKVIGRWDRVDVIEGQAILTDYKSAAVNSQEQADRRARDSLQLSLYALAYEKTRGQSPSEVRLHFLESGLVGRSPVPRQRLHEAISQVRKAAAGIRSRDYTPRPRARVCQACAYREICPATSK